MCGSSSSRPAVAARSNQDYNADMSASMSWMMAIVIMVVCMYGEYGSPLKCVCCHTEHDVVCRATGPCRGTGWVGWMAVLTDLTAPGLSCRCAVAFDGWAGQAGGHGGLRGIGSFAPGRWGLIFSTCSRWRGRVGLTCLVLPCVCVTSLISSGS